jgi:hypothetical protein
LSDCHRTIGQLPRLKFDTLSHKRDLEHRLTGDVVFELFNDELLITDNVLDQVAY